jgi:hypothetical protein
MLCTDTKGPGYMNLREGLDCDWLSEKETSFSWELGVYIKEKFRSGELCTCMKMKK